MREWSYERDAPRGALPEVFLQHELCASLMHFSHFAAFLRASRLAQIALSSGLRRTNILLLARARRPFTSRVAVRAPARKVEVLEYM